MWVIAAVGIAAAGGGGLELGPELAPSLSLLVAEALVEQSSGRHRPQFAVQLRAALPVAGRFGLAAEVFATTIADRTGLVAVDQHLVRPAALATLTFARAPTLAPPRPSRPPRLTPHLAFDLGLGPALVVTHTVWTDPARGGVTTWEPAARGVTGLELGLGPKLRVRGQGGLAARPSGVDHDYGVGVAWAF